MHYISNLHLDEQMISQHSFWKWLHHVFPRHKFIALPSSISQSQGSPEGSTYEQACLVLSTSYELSHSLKQQDCPAFGSTSHHQRPVTTVPFVPGTTDAVSLPSDHCPVALR